MQYTFRGAVSFIRTCSGKWNLPLLTPYTRVTFLDVNVHQLQVQRTSSAYRRGHHICSVFLQAGPPRTGSGPVEKLIRAAPEGRIDQNLCTKSETGSHLQSDLGWPEGVNLYVQSTVTLPRKTTTYPKYSGPSNLRRLPPPPGIVGTTHNVQRQTTNPCP